MTKAKTTAKKIKKERIKKPKETTTHPPRPPAKRAPKKPKEVKKPVKYFEGLGRRKTSVARVRLLTKKEKMFSVNEKPLEKYFPFFELQQIVTSPLQKMNCLDKFGVSIKVKGGGYHAQAEAVRHGIAKALILFNPDFRKRLKKAGFLTRDARMRERKKFGLKRARRAPQWSKR